MQVIEKSTFKHSRNTMTDNDTIMSLSRRIALESKLLSDMNPAITVRVRPLEGNHTDIRGVSVRKLDPVTIRIDFLDSEDKEWNHHLTTRVTRNQNGIFLENPEIYDMTAAHLKKSSARDIGYDMTINLQDRVIHHMEDSIGPLIEYAINLCLLSTFTPKNLEST